MQNQKKITEHYKRELNVMTEVLMHVKAYECHRTGEKTNYIRESTISVSVITKFYYSYTISE